MIVLPGLLIQEPCGLHGGVMKQYGIVDIGSNTIVLIIYDSVEPVHVKEYWSEPVHLVSYNDNGYMKPEGTEKALAVLRRYKTLLDEHQVDTYFAFITEPWRRLNNTDEFLSRLAESGFAIDTLSGQEEAEYDFYGSRIDCADIREGNAFDIGGGSTELISFRDSKIHACYSLPAGCVRLKELPVTPETAQSYLRAAFEACPFLLDTPSENLIGIGGTARACALLAEELYPGTPVTRSLVRTLLNGLLEDDAVIVGAMKKVITPGRWTVLAPGLNMLGEIMDTYHADSVRISEGCVREGYLLKHVPEDKPF